MTLEDFYIKAINTVIEQAVEEDMTKDDFILLHLLDISRNANYEIFDIQRTPEELYVAAWEVAFYRKYLFYISTQKDSKNENEIEKERPGFDQYFIYSYEDKTWAFFLLKELYTKSENALFYRTFEGLTELRNKIEKRDKKYTRDLLNGKVLMTL